MERRIQQLIDAGCIPTMNELKEKETINAIYKCLTEGKIDGFSSDLNGRLYLGQVSANNFYQALLEHVVKFDALMGITVTRNVDRFSSVFSTHKIGESELRIFRTLKVAVDDVFNTKNDNINTAYMIITMDKVALMNIITSFVEYRYVQGKMNELDTEYMNHDTHKQIIWKIDEYFNNKLKNK